MKITINTAYIQIQEEMSSTNIAASNIEDIRRQGNRIINIQSDTNNLYKIVHSEVTEWNGSTTIPDIITMEGIFNALMVSASGVGGATETTLQAVLSAIISADQDIEIMLVRDEGNGGIVVRQIINYETGTPVVTYEEVDGTPYTPVGPLVYLDPSAVLNLILSESLDQGLTLDAILADTANLDVALSSRATEATAALIKTNTDLLAPATRIHNSVVSTGVGSVPIGSLRGSVLNSGSTAGTWNGISIPAGVSIGWGEVGQRDTYAAINFDATGTTFIIEYTT